MLLAGLRTLLRTLLAAQIVGSFALYLVEHVSTPWLFAFNVF